jgi:hypothetical protein
LPDQSIGVRVEGAPNRARQTSSPTAMALTIASAPA